MVPELNRSGMHQGKCDYLPGGVFAPKEALPVAKAFATEDGTMVLYYKVSVHGPWYGASCCSRRPRSLQHCQEGAVLSLVSVVSTQEATAPTSLGALEEPL